MDRRLGGGISSRRVYLSIPSYSIIILLLLHLPIISSSSSSFFICNIDTDYKCICQNETSPSLPPPSPSIPPCSSIIKVDSLPSVDMRVRHVNFSSNLSTGEKYEKYFKRRIANIISNDCEKNTNQCPGLGLRLNESSSPHDDIIYGMDRDDPLITQDNVLILRLQSEPLNVTRILFNVIKTSTLSKASHLTPNDILDPVKVKFILGSQRAPLSRVLGGIRIQSVRVGKVDGRGDEGYIPSTIISSNQSEQEPKEGKDNTRLIVFVSIVGTFFVICYIIGGYRLYRDCQKRKKKKATEESQMIDKENEKKKSINYGTINNHPNGGMNTVIEEPVEKETSFVTITRPHVMSDRQARLMFGCDPSQLPKEASFDGGIDGMNQSIPSSYQQHHSSPSQRHHPSVPAVVLLSSHSLSRDSPLADTPISINDDTIPSTTTIPINQSSSPPSHRPKSRRGSRIDDQIDNIDLTETTIQHIMDKNEDKKKRLSDEAVWSSSEGEMDVYYKLSEEEELVKGDEWPNGLRDKIEEKEDDPSNVVTFCPPRKRSIILHDESSDEEDDDEDDRDKKKESIDIRDDDDLHAYERLREEASPNPISFNQSIPSQYSHEDDDDNDSLR